MLYSMGWVRGLSSGLLPGWTMHWVQKGPSPLICSRQANGVNFCMAAAIGITPAMSFLFTFQVRKKKKEQVGALG